MGTIARLLALAVLRLAWLIAFFAFLVEARTVSLRTLAVLRLAWLVAALARLIALLAVCIEARTVGTRLLPGRLQSGAEAFGTEAAFVFVVRPVGRIGALHPYTRAHGPVSTLIVKAFCLLVAVTATFGLTGRQTLVFVFQFF